LDSGDALNANADAGIRQSDGGYRLLPESGAAGAAVLLGTALACFVAQWITIQTWVPPAQVSTVWASGGLMLGIILLTAPRRWPVVITAAVTGAALLYLYLGLGGLFDTSVFALLFAVITIAVATALRAALRRPLALVAFREFLIYLAVVVVGGALLAASLFLAVTRALGYGGTFLHWRTLALAAMLGYLTMTPTVVLLVQGAEGFRHASVARWIEASLLGLLLALASGFMFSGAADRLATWTGFAMTLPPLLLWATMRFGTLGASAALLLVSVIATYSSGRGLGPFSSRSPADNTLALQLFILGTGVPLLGLAVVLTEQQRTRDALKASHTQLRGLSRELIAAREEEGTRIARELHDDVGQRLALVMFGLSRLRRGHPEAGQLQEQTRAIAQSLRQISHQLHPAALEQAGLAAVLELTCEEIRQATGLGVGLVQEGDSTGLPREVALCLYRVAQEALTNVVRHAGARRVGVVLRRGPHGVDLEITDDGRGLGGAAARGLGLRSAGERVAAVGGRLTLANAPGGGTTVRVTIPLGETHDA
jgi:signal transduction histidine kinase